MQLIPVSLFRYAVVSDQDYPILIQRSWYEQIDTKTGKSYAYSYDRYTNDHGVRCRRKVYMHRVITNCPSGYLVDHWDHDGLNNQRYNLRIATYSQNAANMRDLDNDGLSEYRGVSRDRKKWRARITWQGELHYLGRFNTAEEAASAYDEAARSFFGEFAWQNFPKLLEQEITRREQESRLMDEPIPF